MEESINIFSACMNGNVELVKTMIEEGVNVNEPHFSTKSAPVHLASISGKRRVRRRNRTRRSRRARRSRYCRGRRPNRPNRRPPSNSLRLSSTAPTLVAHVSTTRNTRATRSASLTYGARKLVCTASQFTPTRFSPCSNTS